MSGKGDRPRPINDRRRYDETLDRVFGDGARRKTESVISASRNVSRRVTNCDGDSGRPIAGRRTPADWRSWFDGEGESPTAGGSEGDASGLLS